MASIPYNKLIIQEATRRVLQGENKEGVFKLYREKVDPVSLANQIAYIPDLALAKKYSKLSQAFLYITVLWIVTQIALLVIDFNLQVSIQSLRSLLLGATIRFAIGIAILAYARRRHCMVYRIAIILALRAVTSFFGQLELVGQTPMTYKIPYFALGAISMLIIVMGFILARNMFPYVGIFRPKTDNDGQPIYTCAHGESSI